MDPRETTIFLAVLTGAGIIIAFVVYFVLATAAYHRKKITLMRRQVSADVTFIEQERARIALDLHDDIGNTLSGIRLKLESPAIQQDPAKYAATVEQLDGVVDKIRDVSFNMLPGVLLQSGLEAAVTQLAELWGISLHLACDIPPLPVDTTLPLFRIIQELLSNYTKHARGNNVSISVAYQKHRIILRYRDNGQGFDKQKVAEQQAGRGLRNIEARADLLAASVYLVTSPGKGVSWHIEFPYG